MVDEPVAHASGGPPPSGATVVRYGRGPDNHGLVWEPLGDPPAAGWPVLVLFHGGYWKGLYDLRIEDHVAPAFAAAGLLTFVPEYRRTGGPAFDPMAMLGDVAAAVDHVATMPGADPARVVVAGHSAGGHLAAWAGLSAGRRRRAVVEPVGCVSQDGVLDLAAAEAAGLGGGAVLRTFGARRDEADPVLLLPARVPVVCVHGAEDSVVPVSQSQRFVTAANEAGGAPARLVLAAGEDHYAALEPGSRTHTLTVEAVLALLA